MSVDRFAPDLVMRALSHPVRREMLAWLKEPEKNFSGHLHPLSMGVCARQFERCGLSQSTVSTHLSTLVAAGLLTQRKVGQWVFYARDEDAISRFRASLSDL